MKLNKTAILTHFNLARLSQKSSSHLISGSGAGSRFRKKKFWARHVGKFIMNLAKPNV